MNDYVNPALRERLEARRESTRAAAVREYRARQPYRPTRSDRDFQIAYWMIALVVAGIIGWLVQ